jgi:predicted nucleotidyltransferase
MNSHLREEIIDDFLDRIFPVMDEIREIHLFGSRCRDDWRPDSDYDLLIVMEKKDRAIVNKLYDAVMDILLDTGRLISLKIFSVEEFQRLRSLNTPFIQNVMKEGVRIG